MLDLVGRVPDPGDSVEVDGFRLTAVDVRGRRIERVRIEPTGAPTDAEADGDGDAARTTSRATGAEARCARASWPSSAAPTSASRPW